MDKIKIDFKNCFGIKELNYTFDFTNDKAYSIYAPNGTMKTSFAKTVKCISEEAEPKDLINVDKVSKAVITKSNSVCVNPDEILVIESYNQDFASKRASTLMVNKELKAKYIRIHTDLETKKENLLKDISPLCGIKSKEEIGKELSNAWGKNEGDIFECLEEIETIIDDFNSTVQIKYKTIFNDKVIDFLKDTNVKALMKDYIEKYDELVTKSEYFTKGVFNHNNASIIGKNLNDNGFFKVKNKIFINEKEIKNKKELDDLLGSEKSKIFKNPDLLSKFEKLDESLTKNATMKDLRDLLENNPEIISSLDDLDNFKKELWLGYLKQNEEELKSLVDLYKSSKEELKKIVEEAKKQKTIWGEVVEIFNERFNVPFIAHIENQQDVILKENTPTIAFKYNESGSFKDVDKMTLLNVLSSGEKRALYILNIIFEIQALIKVGKTVMIVVDDIADSFDYKNKYAIIEYLNDILKSKIFRMIILTHNFDFYRTIKGRLNIPRENCLMTLKNDKGIKLLPGDYFKDIFNVWKNNLNTSDRILIASIPFVRNLSEYLEEKNSKNYILLTNILHIKEETDGITIGDLETVYNEIWKIPKNFKGKDRKIVDVLNTEAEKILKEASEKINLENKIVLSIAIRLEAEEFMIDAIIDKKKIGKIKKNQTVELFTIFKEENQNSDKVLRKLAQVNLMTPENIHMNSFMYEPILDLSDFHLKKLYINIREMNSITYKEAAATNKI
ncbi:hypothetical protein [Clostridium sp.]